MRKVLFVTGQGASHALFRLVGKENVFVSKESVAALLTPQSIASQLEARKPLKASLIVVPGSVLGDVDVIREKAGVPCVKGPRHLYNLQLMLDKIGVVNFSATEPAEEILAEEIKRENKRILEEGRKPVKDSMKIGGENKVSVGGITRIVAEIPDSTLLSDEELISRAKYFKESGASIIDLGLVSGGDSYDKIECMLGLLRDAVDAPLSVDSTDEKEILAAVDAGADLILSLDEKTIRLSHSFKTPCVVVARDEKGVIPPKVSERVTLLEKLLAEADCPAIADPLLNPLGAGFTWSVASYIKFRGRNPDTPMMMGAGNVTELVDADSPGVNMLLAGFAAELSMGLLFTTEASVKTRFCVRELSRACEMMYVALRRGQPPKDLGFDLLSLKDKRVSGTVGYRELEGLPVVEVSSERASVISPSSFRVFLKDGKITVACYIESSPSTVFRGDSAAALYKEVAARGLAWGEHIAYLGKELYKAEIALRLGKDYVQDGDLF